MRTHAALDVTKMERAIYADAMDHLTLATVILDASAHVIHTNALARDILHRQDGISLSNESLLPWRTRRTRSGCAMPSAAPSRSAAPPSPASWRCCGPAVPPAPVTTAS